MIKKYLTIALAALAFVACAPEYDTDKIPVIIEELPTSGEGKLLDKKTGKETVHSYSFNVTPEGVQINATISKADDNWVVGYFILNPTMLFEQVGDANLADWDTFHSTTADIWSTYKPGEWVDADGKSTTWDKGHVYWFYQNFANYENFEMKNAFCIGHNPGNDVVGETITSKCVLNGLPFNVTFKVVE